MAALAPAQPLRKRDEELDRYISLKLAALGQPVSRSTAGTELVEIAATTQHYFLLSPHFPFAGDPLLRSYCSRPSLF